MNRHMSVLITDTPENIALDRPAWQNSVYRTFDAHLAVDGNDESNFAYGHCSHTFDYGDKYWAKPLGSVI